MFLILAQRVRSRLDLLFQKTDPFCVRAAGWRFIQVLHKTKNITEKHYSVDLDMKMVYKILHGEFGQLDALQIRHPYLPSITDFTRFTEGDHR